jgi:hypothetical protein
LTDGLQESVSRFTGGVVGDDQRLVDEQAELVEYLGALHLGGAGHGLGSIEVEAAHECGQVAEQDSFGLGEQRVRPVHRGAQRLLASHRRPGAAGEESEAVVQAAHYLVERRRPYPRGGQFDSQWHAVETTTDLGDRLGVVLGDREVWTCAPRAVGE